MKIKNHDYSMYLGIGKNPKYQIVRHLSGIWDFKSNKKQQFIKHQIGDVKISLLFDIKNLLKKKGGKLLDTRNHYIIDCSKIDDSTNQNFRLIIELLSSFKLIPDLNLFSQFPKYDNLERSYLYLESTMELDPSNTRQKLVNDVHIEVGGKLGEVGNMDLDEIQKKVTLSMSAGKYFLASSDKKNHRILLIHSVDMRDKPKLIAECECGFVISGKATSKTYMTSFDVPTDKTIKNIFLDAEL